MELLMRAVLGVKHNQTLQPHRWRLEHSRLIFNRIFDNISLWSRCVACSLEASSDLQPPLSLLATNIYVAHVHILVLVPPFPSWVLGTVSEINSAGSILQHSLEKSYEDWGLTKIEWRFRPWKPNPTATLGSFTVSRVEQMCGPENGAVDKHSTGAVVMNEHICWLRVPAGCHMRGR